MRALTIAPLLVALSAVAGASARAQAPKLEVQPAKPAPGALVRLTLTVDSLADSVTGVRGTMAGEPLHFVAAGEGVWRALGAVPVDGEDSLYARVVVRRASGTLEATRTALPLRPLPPPSVSTSPQLAVSQRFTRPLDAATQARIARETARARAVGRRAHESAPRWSGAFLKPRTSRVTSEFGTGRAFNGAIASRHLGVDFAGAVGAPIKAANRGVVALVDTFFLAGRVVYIDHGGGLVTGYFHMSEPLVSKGDTVARGQVIGRVGSTGRVTGPHLHWTARYGKLTVDPLDLIELDTDWYRPHDPVASQNTRAGPGGSK
ncbi:MAG TPA: M23 family metallopeptidase [Gemmatimonadaceae bacterium]|nr:M23 family metallopeptidase [Gemmatimonadaceae bacterium]